MWVQKCGSCVLVVGAGWRCAGMRGVFWDVLVMQVEKAHGVWSFWRCFGFRAAHGQEKYALFLPRQTEFWESAGQLPSGNVAR